MARGARLTEVVEETLVADVERAVRAASCLALTKLTRVKLAPAARIELERRLLARGLQRCVKGVRVPVEEQIVALLAGGARVALKDVAKRVKGAAKAELDATIAGLARAGRARVVVRTEVEVLVGAGERALEPAEITQVVKVAAQLRKTLKKVSAKGRARSILREDLAALLAPVVAAARADAGSSIVSAVRVDASAGARSLLDDALRRLEDPALKLVRVPDLVRALAGKLALAEVHRALAAAVDEGAIELRPEAGGEFLKAEDAALCPPGPRDSVFSYARRLTR